MIVAPTTAVPFFSLTLPLIEDVVTCAKALTVTNIARTARVSSLIVFLIKNLIIGFVNFFRERK